MILYKEAELVMEHLIKDLNPEVNPKKFNPNKKK